VPKLYRYLREHRIQLLHCKDPESAFYAAPVARSLGIPVVWTCTSWWHAERGWKSAFYERFFSRILVYTELIKDKLVEMNPALAKKIVVTPAGVDTSAFKPMPRDASALDELEIPAESKVVTLLARFQEVKGHGYFLSAATKILQKFPETRFLIVGDNAFNRDDAETYRRSILERIEHDTLLRSRVILAGFRRDIPRLLSISNVLVCPSLFETYGMSNLEAMACGVPVVSTNVGGPSETVIDGETGFLVPPKDASLIAARVCALLGDDSLREKMGTAGRERVLRCYTLERNVACLEQVYRDVVGNKV
jgi:glycosyltransferase involved in cell wall biosynthesis